MNSPLPAVAPSRASSREPIIGSRVELQLLTTLRCNLSCTYCSLGVGDVRDSQSRPDYDIEQLATFVDTHLSGKEVYVTFYGGEPTLNHPMMEAVMRRFPQFRFQIQTNGTLLTSLPPWMLARFSNVLVSIDGGESTTDGYRGRGIWRKVLTNIAAVRDTVDGTVTARVTWGNPDTTFEEIDQLVATNDAIDYLYWQFVADEMYGGDSVAKRKAVLVQLIDRFFASTDTLYPLIPIMGIVRNKVVPSRATELYSGLTQCRVSSHLLNVMPNGEIYPCPDMLYDREMLMGEIQGNWLSPSRLQHAPEMPCSGCEASSWCRGNCMKNLWRGYVSDDVAYREAVVEPICELIRFMGAEIDRHDPHAWFARLPVPVRRRLIDNEIYEYVEIMP